MLVPVAVAILFEFDLPTPEAVLVPVAVPTELRAVPLTPDAVLVPIAVPTLFTINLPTPDAVLVPIAVAIVGARVLPIPVAVLVPVAEPTELIACALRALIGASDSGVKPSTGLGDHRYSGALDGWRSYRRGPGNKSSSQQRRKRQHPERVRKLGSDFLR